MEIQIQVEIQAQVEIQRIQVGIQIHLELKIQVLKHNIVILSNKIAKINIFGNFSKRREVYGYIFL